MGDALQQGREGLVALFQDIDGPADEMLSRTIGSLLQALLMGVWVQWIVDPERAPSGEDLAEARRYSLKVSGQPRRSDDGE